MRVQIAGHNACFIVFRGRGIKEPKNCKLKIVFQEVGKQENVMNYIWVNN